MRVFDWCLLVLASVCGYAQPVADHHQHFLRAAVAPPEGLALTASDLVAQMDKAGIRRAVVLSIAYQFGNPNRPAVVNEYERVKAENDWTREQAALAARRIRGSMRG